MPLPISTVFTDLPDPRSELHRRHRLTDVLTLALCGVVSGAEGREDIAAGGRSKKDFSKRFLPLPGGIPSHDTCHRLWTYVATFGPAHSPPSGGRFCEGGVQGVPPPRAQLRLGPVALSPVGHPVGSVVVPPVEDGPDGHRRQPDHVGDPARGRRRVRGRRRPTSRPGLTRRTGRRRWWFSAGRPRGRTRRVTERQRVHGPGPASRGPTTGRGGDERGDTASRIPPRGWSESCHAGSGSSWSGATSSR